MESDAQLPGPKPSTVTPGSAQAERPRGADVSAADRFEERHKELETLIYEFQHDMWQRGCPVPTDAGTSATDQEAFVHGLAGKLESGLQVLPPQTSALTPPPVPS